VLKNILVPLDGSTFAQRAFPYVQVLARRAHARVILLRTIEGGFGPAGCESFHVEMRQAQEELAILSNELDRQGIAAVSRRPLDEASWAIVRAAQEEQADLIVMSTRNKSGMGLWACGSVAERVLRVGPAPMLMVPPDATFNWPSEPENMRIVVPLDGSEGALGVLGIATNIAEVMGGTIILVEAFHPPTLPWTAGFGSAHLGYDPVDAAERIRKTLAPIVAGLTARGIRSELYVHEGQAHDVILDAVAVHQAHLIAMSTHGRAGLTGHIMGSVAGSIADAVLRETRVALLLARPPSPAVGSNEEIIARKPVMTTL
jgi:nucleotide-binding universal stress UspA family protein